MKCKEETMSMLWLIQMTLNDSHQYFSKNTMKESIELIEAQLKKIKEIEGIK